MILNLENYFWAFFSDYKYLTFICWRSVNNSMHSEHTHIFYSWRLFQKSFESSLYKKLAIFSNLPTSFGRVWKPTKALCLDLPKEKRQLSKLLHKDFPSFLYNASIKWESRRLMCGKGQWSYLYSGIATVYTLLFYFHR